MEQQELKIGGVVVFIDPHRMEQMALVTAIHGDPLGRTYKLREDGDGGELDEEGNPVMENPGSNWPCINLVIVSPNTDCQDPYGRQLERHTSIVHQSNSSAVGNCFRFEGEKLMDQFRQPTVS